MIRMTVACVVCLAAATSGFAANPGDATEDQFVMPVTASVGDLTDESYDSSYESAPRALSGTLQPVAIQDAAEEPLPEPEEPAEAMDAEAALPGYTEGCIAGCTTCCEPQWYGAVEALWLTRNRVRPYTLSMDDTSPGGDVIVGDTDALKFDYRPGFRVTIGHYINSCNALEFSYFGISRWTSNARTPFFPNGGLDPFWGNDMELIDLRNFDNALQHWYRYKSQLHNAELNMREFRGDNSSVLVGIRYLNIRENFRFLSFDSGNAPAIAVNPQDIGIYDIDTNNHLIGLQVGGERRWGDGRWQFGARGKAGLFLNFSEQESQLYDANFTNIPAVRTNLRTKADDVNFATVVDLGLFTTFCIHDNVKLRAGYDVFFVNNVSLAPEQLDVPQWNNSRTKLSDNGSVIYHGPSAGLEFNW